MELKDLIDARDAGEDDFLLVDVREPDEYEIVSIPGAVLIPKGEFLTGAALATLPQDKRIVLHCKSGVRSAEVLAVLKAAGFADAVHVGGGVLGLGQPDRAAQAVVLIPGRSWLGSPAQIICLRCMYPNAK